MPLDPHHPAADPADAVALAKAETVGFDDIDTNGYGPFPVLNGYAKLDWSNFYAIDPDVAGLDPASGFFAGITSGRQIAYDGNGTPCSVSLDGTFTANSVELTAAWDRKLVVEITGYRHGKLVDDLTVELTDRRPTDVHLGFKGVDEVLFTPLQGKPDPSLGGHGSEIVFDDFSFSRIKGEASSPSVDPKAAIEAIGASDGGALHSHLALLHAIA